MAQNGGPFGMAAPQNGGQNVLLTPLFFIFVLFFLSVNVVNWNNWNGKQL